MPTRHSPILPLLLGLLLLVSVENSATAVPPPNQLNEPGASRRYQPQRPVVSPYLGIARTNFQRPATNLYTLVIPRIEQQQTALRQARQIEQLERFQQEQLDRTPSNEAQLLAPRATGYRAGYDTHHRYFSTHAEGRNR